MVRIATRPSPVGVKEEKEGLGSMVARPEPVGSPTAEAIEFVRFCYRRRRVGWPELYDEMCAVAGRGSFRGWDAEELGRNGIRFTLLEMPVLATLVGRVVAEEREIARTAPVAVAATA